MTTSSAARENFLTDIITTAVEGGIWYWSRVSEYHWFYPDLDGGTAAPGAHGGGNAHALVHEEDGPIHTLNHEVVEAALTKIASGVTIKYLGSTVRTFVRLANPANDSMPEGHYGLDSDIADQIVQVALLGEVVYG